MSLHVLLVHAGARNGGGVTVDVEALDEGLRQRGHDAAIVSSLTSLARRLRRQPAIVHAFGCLPSPTTFGAMAIAKLTRSPLVWTPVFHPSRRRSWKGYGWLRAMEAFDALAPHAARLSGAVIAATDAEADFFRSMGARRVDLIPPGVPRRPEHDEDAEVRGFRARMKLNGGPVVLTVARDNSRKALPFGVEAFRSLRLRRPDAALVLVGADPARWSGEPGVLCPGWLAPEEVELAYRAADVLFVPSLYEGLPRAVIEAWSFGVPVVATDRVALAPTIDEVGGRVVRYGEADGAAEALASLLADGEQARRYGDAGRRMAEQRFSIEDGVARTEALYRELVG